MWIAVRTLAVPKGSIVSNYFLGCLEPPGIMQKIDWLCWAQFCQASKRRTSGHNVEVARHLMDEIKRSPQQN